MKNSVQDNSITAIGLMSGTSCDGLDIAYCRFSKKEGKWSYDVLAAKTLEYTLPFVEQLHCAAAMDGKSLIGFDREFGVFCGKAVRDFLSETKLPDPAVIGSHGHTIFHTPEKGVTYQLGSGASLFGACNIPVACDFRSVDVALGGQGAPLVPLGDKYLFSSYDYCLNLGGISNISYRTGKRTIAFDICPINIVLNYLAGLLGMPYDKDGLAAASGSIDQPLLMALNKLDFYTLSSPKSLGKEWVDETFMPVLKQFGELETTTLLATCVEHMAIQLASAVKETEALGKRLLATGGGAFNKHLIASFAKKLEGVCTVEVPDQQTVAFKEAIIFALLGALRLTNEHNVLSSATGSTRDHCGGALYSG